MKIERCDPWAAPQEMQKKITCGLRLNLSHLHQTHRDGAERKLLQEDERFFLHDIELTLMPHPAIARL